MGEKMEKHDVHQAEANSDSHLMNGVHYTGDKGPCFGTRHVMIIMMAIGTSGVTVTRTVFSSVLVAMTNSTTSSNPDIPTYDWDNKGVILSSVMWLGIPIQIIAGQWGKQYGHKWFILGSIIVNSVFFMLIPPFASLWGSTGVIICRIIEGGAGGVLGPVSASIGGIWVPAEERSKAGMISIGAAFIINMVAYVACGQLTASSLGYPVVCYIVGAINLLWCVAWYFLAHQSPSTYPKITPEERKYIETSLSSTKTEHLPTPWLKFLTSLSFWAPVVAGIGTNWIDTVMSSVNLLYSNKVWDLDVAKATSVLAVAPLVGMAVGIFVAPLSDYLIANNYIRIVNARRLFQTVGIVGNSIVLLWMTWIPAGHTGLMILNGCLSNICTILFNVGGAGLNVLDIAPSFVSVIGGFSSTLSQSIALFAPMAYDWIVTDERDPAQWRILFYITAAITTSSAIFFDIFATDKRKWEHIDDEDDNN